MFSMFLPYPPSINNYYGRGRNGVYIKKGGKVYRTKVFNLVKAEGKRLRLSGKLKAVLTVYPPDNRKRDIDNILKAFLDSLTHAYVYKDDSLIKDLHVKWEEPTSQFPQGQVYIKITKVRGA